MALVPQLNPRWLELEHQPHGKHLIDTNSYNIMQTPKDGGPAFPCWEVPDERPHQGMSLRDYFAGQALVHIGFQWAADNHELAKRCYGIADAMLKARTSCA